MVDKKDSLEEKIATREHFCTDMGTGGSNCSNCHYDLGGDPLKEYDKCPGCNYKLIGNIIHEYNFGGSDF